MPETALNAAQAGERAERLAQRLSALYEILQAIATSLETEHLLPLIMDKACSLLEVERCGLFLVEMTTAGGTVLRGRHLRGIPEEDFGRIQLAAGEGITAQVIAQERTLWTEDILADARFPLSQAMRALLAAHDIRGILAAPVVVGRRVFGMFYLFPEPGRTFGPDEADFFSALTLLIGVTVEARRAILPEWVTPPA